MDLRPANSDCRERLRDHTWHDRRVQEFPEPTRVGSGIPGTHAPRKAWVRSNQSSEPTRFWSFIFRGCAGIRSSVFGVLGVSHGVLGTQICWEFHFPGFIFPGCAGGQSEVLSVLRVSHSLKPAGLVSRVWFKGDSCLSMHLEWLHTQRGPLPAPTPPTPPPTPCLSRPYTRSSTTHSPTPAACAGMATAPPRTPGCRRACARNGVGPVFRQRLACVLMCVVMCVITCVIVHMPKSISNSGNLKQSPPRLGNETPPVVSAMPQNARMEL